MNLIEVEEIKLCIGCKSEKPISEFHGVKRKTTYCKFCTSVKVAAYRKRNPEKFAIAGAKYRTKYRAAVRKSYEKHKERHKVRSLAYRLKNRETIRQKLRDKRLNNPEESREKDRKWYSRNKERIAIKRQDEVNKLKSRGYSLKRKYGISIECFSDLVEKQSGKCRWCGIKFTKSRLKNPVVHHSHVTGHVAGIICLRCNMVEGAVGSIKVVKDILKGMEQDELLSYQSDNKELELKCL